MNESVDNCDILYRRNKLSSPFFQCKVEVELQITSSKILRCLIKERKEALYKRKISWIFQIMQATSLVQVAQLFDFCHLVLGHPYSSKFQHQDEVDDPGTVSCLVCNPCCKVVEALEFKSWICQMGTKFFQKCRYWK